MNTNERVDALNCKEFQSGLPDLVLQANALPSAGAAAHMRACSSCTEEYLSFQSTFSALDAWRAPEVSPYFDQKVAVRIREAQAAPKLSWLERLQSHLLFNTGRNFRPAMAGALALALIAGGGGLVGIGYSNVSTQPSATVNDLQILDKNEQAFQQLDELQQDDNVVAPGGDDLPSNGTAAPLEAPPS